MTMCLATPVDGYQGDFRPAATSTATTPDHTPHTSPYADPPKHGPILTRRVLHE